LHLSDSKISSSSTRLDNAWKLHATYGLTATASRFNQWQRAFAVIPKNSTLFYGAWNRDAQIV